MEKFNKHELMELFLSVHFASYGQFDKKSPYDEEWSTIFEDFASRYEVGEYGEKMEKEKTDKLLEKILILMKVEE